VTELDSPPSHPVEWTVTKTYTAEVTSYTVGGEVVVFDAPYPTASWDETRTVTALTAWQAWEQAQSDLGSPTFGSCRVRRVG
jgi:hypothetical protein